MFAGERVLPSACLVLTLHGIAMQVAVVRGWSPASPVYTVTRAEGSTVWEIDGEPATVWYRRFFTVGGTLAPMPETANRFPLLIEGPRPERQGLYRSLRAFDQPCGAVTFWGDLETGDRVRLSMSNDTSLASTAAELLAGSSPGRPPDAALLYSCIGRELVLGEAVGAGGGRPPRRAGRHVPLGLLLLRGDRPHAARRPRLLQPHRRSGAASRGRLNEGR